MGNVRKWLRRLLKALGALVAALLVLAVAGFIYVRWQFNGRNLATFIANQLNPRIVGRIEIGSVEWPASAVLRPRAVPVTIRNVKIWDEAGELVLEVAHATAEVDGWEIIRPGWIHEAYGDIRARHVRVKEGRAVVRQLPSDDPLRSKIGLIHAFQPRVPPAPDAPLLPGPIYDVRDVTLEDVDLLLDFFTWKADVRGIALAGGTLWRSDRDPLTIDFLFDLKPRAREGTLWLGAEREHRFDLEDVVAARFGAFPDRPHDLQWDVTAATVEGARVACRGSLTDLYDPDPLAGGVHGFHLRAENAGGLAARHSEGHATGADAAVTFTIDGDYATGLKMRVVAERFDVHPEPGGALVLRPDTPPLPSPHVVRAVATYDDLAQDGRVEELVVRAMGGEARIGGLFDLTDPARPYFDLDVEIGPDLRLGPWLPPEALKLAGAEFGGRVKLSGVPDNLTASKMDVHLGRARARGEIHWHDGVADTEGLELDVPEVAATGRVRGGVNTRTNRIEKFSFRLDVRRLAPWLRRFRVPLVARSGTAQGTVRGTVDRPLVDASVTAAGVPVADRVDLRLAYSPGALEVKQLASGALGGSVTATGRLRLGRRPSIERFDARGRDLDLSRVPGLEALLGGVGEFRVDAEGPLDRPRARLGADVRRFAVGGEPLGDVTLEVAADERGLEIVGLELGNGRGGTLFAKGRVGYDTTLALGVGVRRLPLATLPGVSGDPELRLGGDATLDVDVAGTLAAPSVEGVLTLARVAMGDTLFGGAKIALTDAGQGRVRFEGKLFQGKFQVDGLARLLPPFDATITVRFKRVEIDEFTTLLSEAYGTRGWVTGSVELRLAGGLHASVRLGEVRLEVDGEDERGRVRPVEVVNLDPVAIEYDGVTARLLEPVRFRGPTGGFTVEGSVGERALDVGVRGKVELKLLEFFTRRWFDHTHGVAEVDVRLFGHPAAPKVLGSLVLKDAGVKPRGQDAEIAVRAGGIQLSNAAVDLSGFELVVDDQVLTVSATLGLEDWAPTTISGEIHGRLAARLLEIVAGRYFSGAGGSAAIDVTIRGRADNPDIDGVLTFDRDFEASPRGLRREVVLTRGGTISFSNKEIRFVKVRGRVDEGKLALNGLVRLYEWRLVDMDVTLDVDGLAHQVPGVLSVEMNTHFRLVGDADELQLRGRVEVVDGRYYERYRFLEQAFIPERTRERETPFWKGKPLFESLRLNLAVKTSGTFLVNNNIAQEMVLTGDLVITGTPPDPRFDGRITVEEGRIKLPIAQPLFQVQSGNIHFSPYERVIEGTTVDLLADSDYTDRDERNHKVHLSLKGPLSRVRVDLWTDTGLNFAQTIFLISLGQTGDDLREQARGDVDPGTTRETTGGVSTIGGQSGAATAVDRVLKDLASDYISLLVEAPLKQVTGIDCVRLEVGSESSLLYLCKRLGRSVKLEADVEQGYRGASRLRGGLSLRLTDHFSLVGDLQQRTPENDAEPVENRSRLQLKWRWVIP